MTNELVMKAILAMDSYNRGYDPKLGTTESQGLGVIDSQIGNAKILSQSNTDETSDEVKAGFYGIAYSYEGESVISYRGTNPSIIDDVVNGWVTGGGAYQTPQAELSAKFFESVVDEQNADPYNMDVSFTGHSLGAALAGLMGSVYGRNATIFDNMPFELAAANVYDASVEEPFDDVLSAISTFVPWANLNTLAPQPFNEDVKNTYYFNNVNVEAPDRSNVKAHATTGEFLGAARFIGRQSTNVKYYDSNIGYPIPVNPVGQADALLTAVDMHSMALLTTLIYADTEKDAGRMTDDWAKIGNSAFVNHFTEALFDDSVAKAAGVLSGSDGNADHMLNKIAYSAIDDGGADAKPFGDTAIKAMFNDANELGKAAGDPDVSSLLSNLNLNNQLHNCVKHPTVIASNDNEATQLKMVG